MSAKGCNCLQLFEAYGCRGEKVLLQISQAAVRRNEEMKWSCPPLVSWHKRVKCFPSKEGCSPCCLLLKYWKKSLGTLCRWAEEIEEALIRQGERGCVYLSVYIYMCMHLYINLFFCLLKEWIGLTQAGIFLLFLNLDKIWACWLNWCESVWLSWGLQRPLTYPKRSVLYPKSKLSVASQPKCCPTSPCIHILGQTDLWWNTPVLAGSEGSEGFGTVFSW